MAATNHPTTHDPARPEPEVHDPGPTGYGLHDPGPTGPEGNGDDQR